MSADVFRVRIVDMISTAAVFYAINPTLRSAVFGLWAGYVVSVIAAKHLP